MGNYLPLFGLRQAADRREPKYLGFMITLSHIFGVLCLFLQSQSSDSAPGQVREAPVGQRYEVVVLGRAQDGGLPHVGCERPCCAEARISGRRELPACLGIIDRTNDKLILIEATPAIDEQIAMLHELAGVEGRGRSPVDGVLLTHAHIGHYLGLAHFGREVASTDSVPVHVSPRFAEYLRTNGPWSQLIELEQIALKTFEPGVPFELLPGLKIEPLPVPHRDEFSDTMAYRIHGPNRTVLFVPDIDRWDAPSVGPEFVDSLFEGVDVAYVDATFYDGREIPGRNLMMIPHPPMIDSMERFADRVRRNPGSIRFIHLNHTNPALHDDSIKEEVTKRGFLIASPKERTSL
ncbi:MAG: pyrroloquinoline quinone biosynthesis protein PqqB [Phycisphaerae bacterium]|nr:pyrroloquinoline quinone biosynthesis protein PqqB [Phycisphaerae bacterium]